MVWLTNASDASTATIRFTYAPTGKKAADGMRAFTSKKRVNTLQATAGKVTRYFDSVVSVKSKFFNIIKPKNFSFFSPGRPAYMLMELTRGDPENTYVEKAVLNTVASHDGNAGGIYSSFKIKKIQKIW